MYHLNQNVTSLKESATLAINSKAAELLSQGETVYRFGFGQSPFPVHENIQRALAMHANHNEYLPTLGLQALREAISAFNKQQFNLDFDPQHIIVGPGSKELIFQLLAVLEGPLLIPAPSWVSYGPQAHLLNKPWQSIQTSRENNYKLTTEQLQQVCQKLEHEPQKILLINSPNNPSGSIYSVAEIKNLVEVCRQHNVLVISDEIYSLVNFSGEQTPSFAQYYPEGTFQTSGLSKAFSAGGYRLGYLAGPAQATDVLNALKAYASETFSAVCAPLQYAAVIAFAHDAEIEATIRRCTSIHKAVLSYAHKILTTAGIDCPQAEGGFYLFPSYKPFADKLKNKGIHGAKDLANYLMNEYHVATLPATEFNYADESYALRLALVDYHGETVLAQSQVVQAIDESFVVQHCPNIVEGLAAMTRLLD